MLRAGERHGPPRTPELSKNHSKPAPRDANWVGPLTQLGSLPGHNYAQLELSPPLHKGFWAVSERNGMQRPAEAQATSVQQQECGTAWSESPLNHLLAL